MQDIVVYRAAKILTMDPNQPTATHVAVSEGRILAVGGDDLIDIWTPGDTKVSTDDQFADAVLMPGFVEGHSHMVAGALWQYLYAGFQDRIDPEGRLWKGLTTIDEVIEGLGNMERDLAPGAPLIGWGFDPIFLTTERLNRTHLDAVSTERPIVVMHSNFHLMTVNSKALELVGYTPQSNIEGLARAADGSLNGELQEMAAMFPIMRRLDIDFRSMARKPESVTAFAKTAMRVGVTTATDLFSELNDEDVSLLLEMTGRADFPLRIVPAMAAAGDTPQNIAKRAVALRPRSTERLRMGAIKVMTDGSIQGYTARVKWPGYVTGHPNGIWNTPPEQLRAIVAEMHRNNLQMHIHVNGDEASEAALDAIEQTLREQPAGDHRHTFQHCQMAGEAQYRRMARLGICVNMFSNHIWFFGDQHAALTVGPERARRMNAARSALDHGVPLAIHSDAPVTPMGPLFTAWCAVNRLTATDKVLGEAQRITVDEALRAITLGAAYTLKLDQEIGSIEAGKKADFAVLGADPTAVAPEALKDVPVLGTVLGGKVFLA